MKTFISILFIVTTLLTIPADAKAASKIDLGKTYDVVVYGGTSGGIAAAIQTTRMGKTTLLIEPGKHLGGLTSGGLGATDIGNKAAIGGFSREFYQRLRKHYENENSWRQEKAADFKGMRANEDTIWKFEPHVAENTYKVMLKEAGVPVLFGDRLDLKNGVVKENGQISQLQMESGVKISGRTFIDTTYEGDLLAAAGVSFHVGREANKTYGETINGIQTRHAVSHQFVKQVDPYIVPGDPKSGLLPHINPEPLAEDGTGDHRMQAYCFRMCTTDAVDNQVDWVKPQGYDPLEYELLLRNFEAGDLRICWNPVFMPNRKTDTNNNFAISTDYIGMNYDYPEASYERREEIIQQHLTYQQGLMWTLAYHSRVPEEVRAHFQRLKPAKDEFTDSNNWPHQLYIREGRRMISDYVMTQHDCQGRVVCKDPVGLAAYTMDSHNIQRYVKDGYVMNEGDVQVGGFSPYPISYRSIRPRKSECENLLVPMCLSSSHIAYGSIRMEPVFMVLSQSAATAACHALDEEVAVQDINIDKFLKQLTEDKQVLVWNGPKAQKRTMLRNLPGIVIDDYNAERRGAWKFSKSSSVFVGDYYAHDKNMDKGKNVFIYRPNFNEEGTYKVHLYYPPMNNRATNVPVTIKHAAGTKKVIVNQRKTNGKKHYLDLGTFTFKAGSEGSVIISTEGTDGYVVADAVQWVKVD